MLELARCRGLLPCSSLGILALSAGLLAAEPAWAFGCEVIDFSAVKQRTRSEINGSTVSTLVATPAVAPGDSVLLEADFGCVVGEGFDPTAANNVVSVEVLESAGGAFAGSFTTLPEPVENVEVFGCVGASCNALRFVMPDSGLAGPARITVTRAGSVVARVFELGARTSSCDVDVVDSLVGKFTLLPNYNTLAVAQDGTPTANAALQAAIAGNGSLLLPLAHTLFGEAAVDAQATLSTGQQITDIPDDRFIRTLSRLFRPLPTINRLVQTSTGQALYGTTDVLRSTIQVQQSIDGTPYPTNFHTLRAGPAGPVVLPNPITVTLEGVSPVVALRSSAQAVALGLSEELLGDLNADSDGTDQLLSATAIATGETADTGQALAQVAASPARPVVSVVGDVVAFLQSEALSGNMDLNGDGQADDLVMRALVMDPEEGVVQLNPDATDTSADPLRAIDGSQLAISQGFVFFRTPEDATAPHATLRVSEVAGMGGNVGGSNTSDQSSIDGLAEHVAYASRAGNLASGASGAHRQILVTDLLSPTPVHMLVSAGPGGEGDGDSSEPAISREGDHVAFTSHATNLGATRVVWERGTNVQGFSTDGIALALFELEPGEEEVPGVDYSPCTASVPGLSLAFASDGTVSGSLFAPDGPACQFEAEFSGTYSVSPAGPVQVGSSIRVDAVVPSFTGVPPLDPSLSDSTLFFSATNIVTALNGASFNFQGSFELSASTDAENSFAQVYTRTLGGGAPVELVSVALGGGGGGGDSGQPAPSGNGQLVAFASAASDLLETSDSNGVPDVFVRDLGSDTTERASVADDETPANGASGGPAITPDGSLVAFASLATNLVGAGADTNGANDVFLRDRAAGTTERASVPAPGGSAAGASSAPDLSNDGRFVVFESSARLVPDDTDAFMDIYLRDRVEGTTERMSVKSGGEAADAASFDPSISGDGRFVVFASLASLVPDAPAGTKVYRRNRVTGSVELLSAGASAGDTSTSPDASGDGRTVAFDSDAALVMNDGLPVDVYVRTTGPGSDLNLDGDDADGVFQSFATQGTTGLQASARVAAAAASTGAGRALVSVPEADQGNANLNETSLIEGGSADGDDDEADAVLHLFDGATAQLVNLGVAGTLGAVSDSTLCVLVDEAQQNGAELGGPGADDQVLVAGDVATLLGPSPSLTNVGIAATQVSIAGTVCVFTAAAGSMLEFYDLASGAHVSSGLPATAIQVGPGSNPLIAFRVPEDAVLQDLNGDFDLGDEVMHAVALSAVQEAQDGDVILGDVTNLGLQAIDCTLPGCEAFKFGSILPNGVVSFLGTEPGETRDPTDCLPTSQSVCDFNGDGQGVSTVVHYVTTLAGSSPPQVTSVGSLALSSSGEQGTPPFGVGECQAISVGLFECEAARHACVETRAKLTEPIPVATDCEAIYDVNLDGVLDCTILRDFIGADSDCDGVPDFIDNATFVSNPGQEDGDGDGVGDAVDEVPSVPPCQLSCDLNEKDGIDQADVDAILAAVAGGEAAVGGALSPECGDRRDRNADRFITFLDASLCKADCDNPDCSPASSSPSSPPPAPAPSGGGSGCGIGIELSVLLPLLMAARRRRSRVSLAERSC